MGWIKLDDSFIDHPKYLEAGPLAGYLCIAGMAWCNRNLTDGFIPRGQVRRLVDFDGYGEHAWPTDAMNLADELVAAGLWEKEERGYRVHDYHDWQRSREQIEAAIEQRREAGRRGGLARHSGGSPAVSLSESSSGPLSEVPSDSLSESVSAPLSETPSEIQARVQAEVRSKKEEGTTRDLSSTSERNAGASVERHLGVVS